MQDVLTRKTAVVIAFALTIAVFVVPAAQANPRPLAGLEKFYKHSAAQLDSRPIYGIGDNMSAYSKHTVKVQPVYGIGDNMSVYAQSARKATKTLKATRPDDRAGVHGVGTTLTSNAVLNDKSDVVSRMLNRLTTHVRPDDRAGTLGIGRTEPPASFGRWDKRLVLR